MFLSHSSKDKESYVHKVYAKLGADRCVYDEQTFEAGMQSLEEILGNLQKVDLFVLFLSNNSLNSDWVHTEILEAKGILD
jgi:hypothetical protein